MHELNGDGDGADVDGAVVVEDEHVVGLVAPADLVRAMQVAGADQSAR